MPRPDFRRGLCTLKRVLKRHFRLFPPGGLRYGPRCAGISSEVCRMMRVLIVDYSAESRTRIVRAIESFLRSEPDDCGVLPRLSLKPISPEELRFAASPDLCFVGPEMARAEDPEIASARKRFKDAAFAVLTEGGALPLAVIEQLGRFGVDDVIDLHGPAARFFERIILLHQKCARPKSGKLVLVDSGKGGLGVTSIVAGLGECIAARGSMTLLVDLDEETQDLSRFLRARPYVNENLQLLFDQTRPVTEQFVRECAVQVWEDRSNLFCLPPIPESEEHDHNRSFYSRTLISVLEVLDSLYGCVIVDIAGARGSMLRVLYRAADALVFVVGGDPAGIYGGVDRLSKLRPMLSPDATVAVVENRAERCRLPCNLLRREFAAAARLDHLEWFAHPIAWSESGRRWPASNGTLFSRGCARSRRSLELLADRVTGAAPHSGNAAALAAPKLRTAIASARERLLGWRRGTLPAVPALPAPVHTPAATPALIGPVEFT